MHVMPVPTSRHLLWSIVLIPLIVYTTAAHAAEVTWTGAVDSSWSEAGNWDGGVPGQDDVAIVPDTANIPVIGGTNTGELQTAVWSGLILKPNASVRVENSGDPLYPNALYIIGPGDLDSDGASDVRERDESILIGNFDVDGDGIPNFADSDSDNDELPDTCEFQYGFPPLFDSENNPRLHPYYPDAPDCDYDEDGFTDARECTRGGDPRDPEIIPLPVLRTAGLIALGLALLMLSVWVLRKAGLRTRRVLSVLMFVALLSLGGYVQSQPLLAASSSVNFALRQTIQGVASTATPGDTLEVNGASVRPWNGQSTYLNRPLTLQAVGGPVFLGGMRATFTAGVLGEGSLGVASAYTGPDYSNERTDYPKPVSTTVIAGFKTTPLFLGERVTLTPHPDAGWGFHGWTANATGSANPLSFQALADGLRATAVFGPPGPDLSPTLDTGPSGVLYAGDSVAADFQIENIGQSDTPESSWDDGLYLSRDTVFDAADLALDLNPHNGTVDAGDDYTASFSATLPDVAPGRYYLLGVADTARDATDANRNNNMAAVGITVLDVNLAQ